MGSEMCIRDRSYSSNRFRILDDTQTLLMILIMFYEIDDHRMIVSDGSYLCNLVFTLSNDITLNRATWPVSLI